MVDKPGMTSSRPYLLRGLNDWIVDNQMTPHLVCDASAEGAVLPMQFVENGKIVLNISPSAVRDLTISNDWISFGARFSGTAMNVLVPVMGVMAIYARENGQGMVFVDEDPGSPPTSPSPDQESKPNRPQLKLVK
ncbi:MAG: ClpXP protease specificity-enhancing factor [Gammaproteobacteria bacterium]|nr:ClpXP protease specificity-enhancing factor [Gammaproteobacteria bacterium]